MSQYREEIQSLNHYHMSKLEDHIMSMNKLQGKIKEREKKSVHLPPRQHKIFTDDKTLITSTSCTMDNAFLILAFDAFLNLTKNTFSIN